MKYRYRVNYGNGQILDMDSKRLALQYIAALKDQYKAFAFVERQDPETLDWFKIR